MKRTVTFYTDVKVEVDLAKFDTDTLMDEIKERGEEKLHRRLLEIEQRNKREIERAGRKNSEYVRIPPLGDKEQHPLHGIYYALKFGKKEHALDLMRDFLGDQFGVVL